jgi:hypothetical protein
MKDKLNNTYKYYMKKKKHVRDVIAKTGQILRKMKGRGMTDGIRVEVISVCVSFTLQLLLLANGCLQLATFVAISGDGVSLFASLFHQPSF